MNSWVVQSIMQQLMSNLTEMTNKSSLSNDRGVPQVCNQFEVAHICRIEWHRMEDREVERNHNPRNQSNPECYNRCSMRI